MNIGFWKEVSENGGINLAKRLIERSNEENIPIYKSSEIYFGRIFLYLCPKFMGKNEMITYLSSYIKSQTDLEVFFKACCGEIFSYGMKSERRYKSYIQDETMARLKELLNPWLLEKAEFFLGAVDLSDFTQGTDHLLAQNQVFKSN